MLAIKKYGKENFTNEIIYESDSIEDLNLHEKLLILEYRNKYGVRNLYNIANGGDGGDCISMMDVESKQKFIDKMTHINRSRCQSDEFKTMCSTRSHERYQDSSERQKQSDKMKSYWDNIDKEKKQQWMDKRSNFFRSHKGYFSQFHKVPCCFEFGDIFKKFDSIGELKIYLKEQWDYSPDNKTIKKLFIEGEKRIPHEFFHSRFKRLNGMMIYIDKFKTVETMGDECNPVEDEIGTSSKRKTEIEEIVRPV